MWAYVVGALVVATAGYLTLVLRALPLSIHWNVTDRAGPTQILFLRLISPRPTPPTPSSLRYLCALDTSSPNSSPGSRPRLLPSTLSTPATLELSIVVPAYDEEKRLKEGLKDALDWLEARRLKEGKLQGALDSATANAARASSPSGAWSPPLQDGPSLGRRWKRGSYEVVIVDDGSKDKTVTVALEIAREHAERVRRAGGAQGEGEIRVVKLGKNRGKGGAVRHVSPPLNDPFRIETRLKWLRVKGDAALQRRKDPLCRRRRRFSLLRPRPSPGSDGSDPDVRPQATSLITS